MRFVKPRIEESSSAKHQVSDFDPRHPQDKVADINYTMTQLEELKRVFPNTGMSHLWHIPDEPPQAVHEEVVETAVDPRQKQMEELIFSSNNTPTLTIEHDMVEFIEKSTRKQRDCPTWKALHKGRVTSSVFHQVLKAGSSPESLIQQIVTGSNLERYAALPPAVKWGVDHEEDARSMYVMLKSAFNENIEVEDTGLTLLGSHSFLGASSDGRVKEGEEQGILEIKYPYSLKGKMVNRMEIQSIVDLEDKSFCLENELCGPQLKNNHPYYTQVQGKMAIMGIPWCDFIVWTGADSNNIFIERIMFDADFVMQMMPKLVQFYVEKCGRGI